MPRLLFSQPLLRGLGILEFALGILEFSVILGLDPRISVLGNSRILSDEILGLSRGTTQARNSSLGNSSFRNSKTRGSGGKNKAPRF